MEYRNRNTGRVVWRPYEDEWLEASAGWEPIEPYDESADADSDNEEEED